MINVIFQKRPHGLWAKAICAWTGGPYFHCAFLNGSLIGAEAAAGSGVHRFAVDYLDPVHWDSLTIPCTHDQVTLLNELIDDELGCGYDWVGMICSQVFGIHRRSKSKWYCSEFVTAMLTEARIIPLGVDPCTVSPNGLADILRALDA